MSSNRFSTTLRLAGITALESTVSTAARALVDAHPDVNHEPRNGEPIAVTTARALVYDCERLLSALYEYRSHLVAKPARSPYGPDQLDWPF
jgi:hypothetical protein